MNNYKLIKYRHKLEKCNDFSKMIKYANKLSYYQNNMKGGYQRFPKIDDDIDLSILQKCTNIGFLVKSKLRFYVMTPPNNTTPYTYFIVNNVVKNTMVDYDTYINNELNKYVKDNKYIDITNYMKISNNTNYDCVYIVDINDTNDLKMPVTELQTGENIYSISKTPQLAKSITKVDADKTKKNVLIIGAGPVGLFTGIQFLLKSRYNVTIVEKYPAYTRPQIFMLQNNSYYETLSMLPEDILHDVYNQGCVITAPAFDVEPKCYSDITYDADNINKITRIVDGVNNIPEHLKAQTIKKITDNLPPRFVGIIISKFEEILNNYFKKIGGKMYRPSNNDRYDVEIGTDNITVKNKTTIVQTFNFDNYPVIIGADSGRSIIKEKLLNKPEENNTSFIRRVDQEGTNVSKKYKIQKNTNLFFNTNEKLPLFTDNYVLYNNMFASLNIDDYYGAYSVSHGLIGTIDLNKTKGLLKQFATIHEHKILHDKLDDTKINNLINSMFSEFNNTTFPYYLNNEAYNTIFNHNNEVNIMADNLTIKQNKESQNRYRFFAAPDNTCYFGINLSNEEYDHLAAEFISELSSGSEDSDIRINKLNKDIFVKDIAIKIPILSMLSFYGMLDDKFEYIKKNVETLAKAIEISAFPISLYKSTKLLDKIKKNYVGIVGDATIGVHYFSGTGVNVGILNAEKMCTSIDDMLFKYENDNDKIRSSIEKYNEKTNEILVTVLTASITVTPNWKEIKEKIKEIKIETFDKLAINYIDVDVDLQTKTRIEKHKEFLNKLCLEIKKEKSKTITVREIMANDIDKMCVKEFLYPKLTKEYIISK